MFKQAQVVSAVAGLLIAFPPGEAGAAEPVCQNNPNVIICDDFETGNFANWDQSTQDPNGWGLKVSREKPLLGGYSLKFEYNEFHSPGSVSKGFGASGADELWVRFYVFFNSEYHWGFIDGRDHAFQIFPRGGVCQANPGSLDIGPLTSQIYRPGHENCGMDRWDPLLNMGTPEDRILRNNKWYRIEYHIKLNSPNGCSDKNGDGKLGSQECDGIYEFWIDGKQVMGIYNANMRSRDPSFLMGDILFNHYYRTGAQVYNGRQMAEYRDNLVVVRGPNGGRPIGPAPSEPFLGNPDMGSPYHTRLYRDRFAFDANGMMIRNGGDCANSMLGQPSFVTDTGGVSYVTSPVYNKVQTYCTAAGGDKAMAVRTTSGRQYSGNGPEITRGFPNKSYAVNAQFYLDPAAFPAQNGAPLLGFFYWANSGRNYIALGVDGQNHPVLYNQKNAGSALPQIVASNTSVTIQPGVWNQLEFRGTEGGAISALVNGRQVVSATGVDVSHFFNYSGEKLFYFGIADHLNNPRPLVAYIDEPSAGTTSFQDCFGWDSGGCPFSGAVPPPPPPPPGSVPPPPPPPTTPPPPPAGAPGTVSNLAASASGTSVNLSFTEVDDGTGQPAKYAVRLSSAGALWGGAPDVTQGTCATPVAGSAIGASKSCVINGLAASTAYQFQIVAFRGTLDTGTAVFGQLSNLASATTGAPLPPPVQGDINGDGTVTVADVQLAVTQALGIAACGAGDVNADGSCSVLDVQLIVKQILGG